MDSQDIIASIVPKRGRGPGRILFKSGLEVSTFDPPLLRTAAENVGKEAKISWLEKPAKDPAKPPYKNLITLDVIAPATPEADITVREIATREVLVPALVKPSRPAIGTTIEQLEHGFALAVRQRELLEEFIRKQFKEGTHYMDGAVFRSKKRVLLLEGARLIHVCHGHRVDFEILAGPMEAQSSGSLYTIVVKAVVYKGDFPVGAGLGSASSLIYSSANARFQDRATSPGLVHNSTLKMAKKSAYIDSCLNTTALTEYTQDLDDYPPGDPSGEGQPKGFIRKQR